MKLILNRSIQKQPSFLFHVLFQNKTSHFLSISRELPYFDFLKYVPSGNEILAFASNRNVLITEDGFFHPHKHDYSLFTAEKEKKKILFEISNSKFMGKFIHLIHNSSINARFLGMLDLLGTENNIKCLRQITTNGGFRYESDKKLIDICNDNSLINNLSYLIQNIRPYNFIYANINEISTSFIAYAMILALQSRNIHFKLVHDYMSTNKEIYSLKERNILDTFNISNIPLFKTIFNTCLEHSKHTGTTSLLKSLEHLNESSSNQYLMNDNHPKQMPDDIISQIIQHHINLVDPLFLINHQHINYLFDRLKQNGFLINSFKV